jgi:tRNA threonylcarbamoyladenosine biosynthesis protein TsaE
MPFIKNKKNIVAKPAISVVNDTITILAAEMNQDLLQLSYNLEGINEAAKQFWAALNQYHTFAFSGEMSAGKTTFIHHLCEYLKVEDTVSSPTFSLINEYHFTHKGKPCVIYHMDWYRLKSTEEAIGAGIEDCITQAIKNGAYCFIEWPEKAPGLITRPYVWLDITTTSPSERSMSARLLGK